MWCLALRYYVVPGIALLRYLNEHKGGNIMDIAALSMVLSQGKIQQRADLSVMKIAMGVASDQSNSIVAMANDTSKALQLSAQPHLGANIDVLG